jgi:hypothetical protein
MDEKTISILFWLASMLLHIAALVVFIYCAWLAAKDWRETRLLRIHGRKVHGKITNIRANFNRTARYFVTYSFYVKKSSRRRVRYEREQHLEWRHVGSVRLGDNVDVVYVPRDPDVSRLIIPNKTT